MDKAGKRFLGLLGPTVLGLLLGGLLGILAGAKAASMRLREDSAGLLRWPSPSMRVRVGRLVGMARRYWSVVCRPRMALRHSSGPHRTTLAAGGSTPYPHSVRVGQGEGETLLGDGASVAHGAGPRHDRGIRTAGKDERRWTVTTTCRPRVPRRSPGQLGEPLAEVGLVRFVG